MITVTKVDDDSIFPLDCSPSITLADLQALLEADVSWVGWEGNDLTANGTDTH